MREVIYGTLVAFILKVVGSGVAFGFNIVVARLLGAEGTGLYFLALTITVIASVIGRIGLDNALLRFVATHATHGEWGKVKGVYALGMRMSVIGSLLMTFIVFLIAPWLTLSVLNKPELVEPLRWMSLSILPFSLLNLQAESLKGLKHIRSAMLIQAVGLPMLSLLLILPLSQLAGLSGVVWAYTIGTVVVALLGGWAWNKSVVNHADFSIVFSFRELWASIKPLFFISLTGQIILPFAPILLLGFWESSEEVGVYGAASRVAMLVSLILVTINTVLAPKFAELYAKGEMDELASTARKSALLISLLASPVFLIFIFGSTWIMKIFGADFESGSLVLTILVMGQVVNVMTGSVGFLLMMSGNEDSMQKVTLSSAVVLIFLCLILIPSLGSPGAAIAAALSLAGMNFASVYMVRHKLGLDVTIWSFVKKKSQVKK